jgi:hypothetical protein
MFVSGVLSGRGLCDELITRPEKSYRLWRVVVCDHETSWYEEAIARAGLQSQRKQTTHIPNLSKINFNITLPLIPRSSKWSLLFRCSD